MKYNDDTKELTAEGLTFKYISRNLIAVEGEGKLLKTIDINDIKTNTKVQANIAAMEYIIKIASTCEVQYNKEEIDEFLAKGCELINEDKVQ